MSDIRPDLMDRPKMDEIKFEGSSTEIPDKYDIVQLKMDGMYGWLDIQKGQYTIMSRTGKIKEEGVWPNERDNYILVGEWMAGSHWAKRQEDETYERRFYAFDCIYSRGYNLIHRKEELYTRRSYLRRAVSKLRDSRYWHEDEECELPIIKEVQTFSQRDWYDAWYDYIIERGYEGLVFKNQLTKFDDSEWARMKKEIEMDYICVGFEPADDKSKYKGLVGAVKGTLIDKDVIVECGGLTDEQRQEYTTNAEKYKGRIFTAKGNDWYPSGSIRHPKFREWREDKTHYECSYNQVPYDIRKED